MKIGYARVSTADQHLRMQEDALKNAGCEEIFSDVVSGVKSQRPGLDKALDYVREGDTLVVWKLDRLGRSIQHLIQMMTSLSERKIGFKSLQESIDSRWREMIYISNCLRRYFSYFISNQLSQIKS